MGRVHPGTLHVYRDSRFRPVPLGDRSLCLSLPGIAFARHSGARHHHRKRQASAARACGRRRICVTRRTARQPAGGKRAAARRVHALPHSANHVGHRSRGRAPWPVSRPKPPAGGHCQGHVQAAPHRGRQPHLFAPFPVGPHGTPWCVQRRRQCRLPVAAAQLPVRPAARNRRLHCLHPRSLGAARQAGAHPAVVRRHRPQHRSTQDHRGSRPAEHQRGRHLHHPRQSLAHGHWSTGHPQGRTPAGVCPHHQRKHLHQPLERPVLRVRTRHRDL